MRVKWKGHKMSGIDFIGEITDLEGLENRDFTEYELSELRPNGWKMSFVWEYWGPFESVPLLVERDVFLWGQNVDNLKNYVDNNYKVIQWNPISTEIIRFPTSYPHAPTLKILLNDRKKQVFNEFSTFPHHNSGYSFDF